MIMCLERFQKPILAHHAVVVTFTVITFFYFCFLLAFAALNFLHQGYPPPPKKNLHILTL